MSKTSKKQLKSEVSNEISAINKVKIDANTNNHKQQNRETESRFIKLKKYLSRYYDF